MIYRTTLYLLILLVALSCSHRHSDPRLTAINELSEDSPQEALDSLNAINYASLSEEDKHFYDFLSVKVPDKAYVRHTSDSLILAVIDYESTHRTNCRYAESLYYGGRVYSDLGDLPTALKYFHDALSETDPDSDIHLRGNIISQTARLLTSLRLNNESIPYAKESLRLDSIENNMFNLTYDHQQLGLIYLGTHKIDEARQNFLKAYEWSKHLSQQDQAAIEIFLAACDSEDNNLTDAMSHIQNAMKSVAPSAQNMSWVYAIEIYAKAGMPDSAYKYSYKLAHSQYPNNRKKGYGNLLSDELLCFSPTDSIVPYILKYRDILEEYYDKHESQQALMQQSLYNYQLHEREKNQAYESRNRIIIGLLGALAFILIIALIFMQYRIKAKRTIIRLRETIDKLDVIQTIKVNDNHTDIVSPIISSQEILRDQLKQKLNQIKKTAQPKSLPTDILNSGVYETLKQYVAEQKFISATNPLWHELYDMIQQHAPTFEKNLHLLLGNKIKDHELQTIILIWYGITPTQMTFLLGKAKGSISSRRESLSLKMLGEKTNQQIIDPLIRLL